MPPSNEWRVLASEGVPAPRGGVRDLPPCHLPLLVAVLAGTGLAGALSQHIGLAFVVLSAMFVTSLILGLNALRRGAERRT